MRDSKAGKRQRGGQRCLIVERHEWETGGRQQQLQFPLDTARDFFGPGTNDRQIQIRVFLHPIAPEPTFIKQITISREYAKSGTRRTNAFPEMGAVPPSFVFFHETESADIYDVWWQTDKAIVAARYPGWQQAKNSQYGRGRLSIIIPGPVPRVIDRVD